MHIKSINQNLAVQNKQNKKKENNVNFKAVIKINNLKKDTDVYNTMILIKAQLSSILKECYNYENSSMKKMSPKIILTDEYAYTDEHAKKAFEQLKNLFAKEPEPTSWKNEKNIITTFSNNQKNIDSFMLKNESNVEEANLAKYNDAMEFIQMLAQKLQQTNIMLRD